MSAEGQYLGNAVEYDKIDSIAVITDGPPLMLLYFVGEDVGLWHVCNRGKRGIIICAPLLQIGKAHGHTVTRVGPTPTITPSVGCEDCGLHGFITSGRWIPA